MNGRRNKTWRSESMWALTERIAREHPMVETVGNHQPNRIGEVRDDGVLIETAKSGGQPELAPTWTFEVAFDYLKRHGVLESRFLQATDGLNIKRSAAVMAVLAHVPNVGAASRPATVCSPW